LKNTAQNETVSKIDHNFVADLAGMEVKVELDNCRKRGREEMSLPVAVHTVCEEDVRQLGEMV
jgi:hypothetical protein